MNDLPRPAIDHVPSTDDEGRNLTGSIVNDLGRAIVTQTYTSKQAFPTEAALCQLYSASRPVVREAVKMLTAKGLLFARKRAGTVVQPEESWNLLDPDVLRWMLERDFSIDLMIDFTEIRMAIEPRAAMLAAQTSNGKQRRAIIDAIDRMFAAERGEDALEADIGFHIAVLEASNNRFLRQFTDLIDTTLRFSIRRTNEYKGVPRASARDHQKVAEAIAAGDARLAGARMHDLIRDALDLLLAAGKQPPRP
ncbi:FadR/GntR family transcriptional regulator [Polymorphobacter fuscus]|uniref:FCD domain-containing protein n=1 Tax=Sandarakinorhabdus fusca TaxID=1439888 RepID=A0A7C9GR05_9SPHN|nr:FadR/GntR family transcriptional regulator [Polymorphobacter fuscus]KAB7644871.1 FadR family transcriptional regulator [Polymorphobacter fuscus]MQT18153.1 FCD domain-containing protein [Polymorphobacter fuscus]NJC09471.1 DNA-binding FadR family transcriptional regulator [Polymorphobacter fuscus]